MPHRPSLTALSALSGFHHHAPPSTTHTILLLQLTRPHPHQQSRPSNPHNNLHKPFHTTPSQNDNPSSTTQTHYDTLLLPQSASPSQIKSQFYTLSKKYHPDLHPNDPHASERFVALSTAYATLGSVTKRAQYDRELAASSPQSAFGCGFARGGQTPAGSHSSAQAHGSPFGARPASGLSKRRGAFRGPPPSFYRSGGWGGMSGKRRAAAEGDATAGAGAAYGGGSSSADSAADGAGPAGTAAGSGGFSPGQGTSHASDYDVPHFDRDGHFRRQEVQDERARIRRRTLAERAAREHEAADAGWLGRLVLVSGVVALAWGLVVFVSPKAERRKNGET